jgi:hypothetical protein
VQLCGSSRLSASPAAADPGGPKVQIRAMTLNAELAAAEAEDIGKLVREQGVDLLALEELPRSGLEDRLARRGPGVCRLLRAHQVSHPGPAPGAQLSIRTVSRCATRA